MKTFKVAREQILIEAELRGWTTKRHLKVPQAISPDKRVHLYFKTQAVYDGELSTHLDIRTMSAADFLDKVVAWNNREEARRVVES